MLDIARVNGINVLLGSITPAAEFLHSPRVRPIARIAELNDWLSIPQTSVLWFLLITSAHSLPKTDRSIRDTQMMDFTLIGRDTTLCAH